MESPHEFQEISEASFVAIRKGESSSSVAARLCDTPERIVDAKGRMTLTYLVPTPASRHSSCPARFSFNAKGKLIEKKMECR